VADDAPGHLAAERVLGLPGYLYPRVAGLLTEPAAAADGGRLGPGSGLLPRPLRGGPLRGGSPPGGGPRPAPPPAPPPPPRPGPLRRCALAAPGRRRYPRAGQVPDDRDLLPVDHDLRRALEPVTGQPSGQPAPYLFRRAGSIALPLGTHVIMITRRVAPRNDF